MTKSEPNTPSGLDGQPRTDSRPRRHRASHPGSYLAAPGPAPQDRAYRASGRAVSAPACPRRIRFTSEEVRHG